MAATIDPRSLGADHLGRLLEVSWQPTMPGKLIHTRIRGVLTHVAHSDNGTSLELDLGALPIHLDSIHIKAASIELTDD